METSIFKLAADLISLIYATVGLIVPAIVAFLAAVAILTMRWK